MTVEELACLVDGEVIGDGNISITMISPLDSPQKGMILYVEKEKYLEYALNSVASALLLPKTFDIPSTQKAIILANDAKLAFIKILRFFEKQKNPLDFIHPSVEIKKHLSIGCDVTIMAYSIIMNNVKIGDNVVIHPYCYIGDNSSIGAGTLLHPHVVIGRDSLLGQNNIIHSGVVIGADGFGYYDHNDKRYKIPQLGFVETGDNVEIGANSTIDRATLGKTRIGSNTKIDNLVQIAHNCSIGENCLIASQVGIAGSCTIGRNVILAGQVGIADHLTLGDDVVVLAQSGVTRSIKPGEMVLGFPAKPVKTARKILASLSRLPHLLNKMKPTQ